MKKQEKAIFTSFLAGILSLIMAITTIQGQSIPDQIDALVSKYHEYGKFNGSVLVADQGEVIYKKGFGWANMEWDIPNAPDTKHRLGSITKQFTAMLILQLAAENKLNLHAPITTYLKDYPKENGDKITIHHLLTHTSGIPNYTSLPGFMADESRNPYKPEEFIRYFDTLELEFTPGSEFSYCNSGYFLLGLIAEKITGKTYEALLHERIFIPLDMNDTGYDNHRDILKNRATGYEKNGNGYINSGYLDMSIPYAAGSMYSTAEDLFIWDRALYTNKLLPGGYLDLYFKPAVQSFGNMYYAYGWRVGNEALGNSTDSIYVITHGGGINGFNTNISRSTIDQSLIVLLNNTGSAPLHDMTIAIRGIMNGKPYDMPKKSLAHDVLSVIQKEGLEAGIAHFYKEKDSDQFDLKEREMNSIGYQLMRGNELESAAAILKLTMETYPKSANAVDSYAEALMNLGNTEEAIRFYKKSIEMNPGNQNGIEMLKKLGVDTDNLIEEVIVPEHILETYLGSYELAPGFVITISKEGDQMKAQATGQPTTNIFPQSENVFYLKEVAAQLQFNKDNDGKVESMTLFQGGREMTGMKM